MWIFSPHLWELSGAVASVHQVIQCSLLVGELGGSLILTPVGMLICSWVSLTVAGWARNSPLWHTAGSRYCSVPATILLGAAGGNWFSHFHSNGLKKAYGNIYIAVLHLSDLELPENILKTWKESFRGLDSNKTSVFCNCFSVFTMGNNSYGQCGRKVVEDEIYRWEFKDPELSYCWKHNCMKTTLQKTLKVEKVWVACQFWLRSLRTGFCPAGIIQTAWLWIHAGHSADSIHKRQNSVSMGQFLQGTVGEPSLHKLLEVVGVSSWAFSLWLLRVHVLFQRMLEVLFNYERGILWWSLCCNCLSVCNAFPSLNFLWVSPKHRLKVW